MQQARRRKRSHSNSLADPPVPVHVNSLAKTTRIMSSTTRASNRCKDKASSEDHKASASLRKESHPIYATPVLRIGGGNWDTKKKTLKKLGSVFKRNRNKKKKKPNRGWRRSSWIRKRENWSTGTRKSNAADKDARVDLSLKNYAISTTLILKMPRTHYATAAMHLQMDTQKRLGSKWGNSMQQSKGIDLLG